MALTDIQEKLGISNRSADLERRLDDGIAESFPASDPVSLSQPQDPHELGVRRSAWTSTHTMLVGGGLLALIAVIALRR